MDHSSRHHSMMGANASIVTTSSDETLFLSSTGDVLVCRDFERHDHRRFQRGPERFADDNTVRLTENFDRLNLIEGIVSRSASKDGVSKNLWGQVLQDDEFSCCDVNTSSCHSRGLCGGAESSSDQYSYSKSIDAAPKHLNGISDNRHSRTANKSIDKFKNERGVAYVNSSDSSVRKLTINTSKSINDEEYDNIDMNSVKLKDHEQWLTVEKYSPTPVMSFDYSCYEPPTPEASQSYDHEEDRRFTPNRKPLHGYTSKSVSMPNLTEDGVDFGKNEINLPTGLRVPLEKQTLEAHPIPPRTSLNKQKEENTSIREKSSLSLPGIPTFFSQLSQIRISHVSAHSRGHHVLLISDEGMLFSYGSNDRGQLGLGKRHTKVTTPQLITPLLENGGKTVNCAAGVDYSLVVVKTEGSRIANSRKQRHHNPALLNEHNAHQQMYAFGNNENNKLGLLDPDKSLNKNYFNGSPRRRWRKGSSLVDSPEPLSPSSILSASTPGSLGDDSTVGDSSTASNDVYLPRRVALHCRVIPKKISPETPIHNNKTPTVTVPYGIFGLAASVDHSAALVKRPNGSVELYTWGRGEDGKLGIPIPGGNEPSTPTRGWETLCCHSMDNDDETYNSLVDEGSPSGYHADNTHLSQTARTPFYVSTPTNVSSLSLILSSEKSAHPPLPKNKFPSRSPRKNQRNNSHLKHDPALFLKESEYLVNLALGPSCTHVITSNGRWLVFGSSLDGVLALGGHVTHAYQPVEVKLPLAFGHEKMSSVSIGETHGISVAASGRAFTWGTSSDGALGHHNKTYIPIPQPITLRHRLHDDALNLALIKHLDCDSWDQTKAATSTISREGSSTDSSPVAHIHAGNNLSVFITRSGSVQTCGRHSGRLGQGEVSMYVSSPKEIFGGIQLWRS